MYDQSYFMGFGSAGQPLYWIYSTYIFFRAERVQFAFALLGLLTLVQVLRQVIAFCWMFFRPSKLQTYCHSPTGSWALVTGASDGIGYAFSEELLERGFNVLLHGRNPQKLARIQSELAQKFPRRSIDLVVADASKFDNGPEVVAAKAKNLPGKLTILVNNVGGPSYRPTYKSYWEMTAEDIDGTISMNARFPSQLTRALFPVLQENQPSLIINCGSNAGELGAPFVSAYAGTKAYLHTLTRATKMELRSEGFDRVDMLGCVIGNTISAGNRTAIPFFTISSKECARGCLDRVCDGDPVVPCHWRHALAGLLGHFVPYKQFTKFISEEMKKRKIAEEKGE